MRDLSEQVSDRSVPRPVYQHDQQSSDAIHLVSNKNASSSNEVRSRQFSHDRYFSRNTAAGELLGIGSQHPPPDNVRVGASLEPIHHEAPESSLRLPMHSRSATNSPPRMSAEQRELKRQRDQARRDSKLPSRIQRATSSPLTQGEFTHTSSISSMPIYTTTPADISLHGEPNILASGMVLRSYSPPLPADVLRFPSPYQQPQYMDYTYPPSTGAPLSSHYGPVSHDPATMYSLPPVMQTGGTSHQYDNQGHVRLVQSKPRPQCWEHGCNGRQFSTFRNLLRHQREKSGPAAKASCPDCGAEFNRTTALNGHLLHRSCRQKHTESPPVIEKYRVMSAARRQEFGEPMDSVSSPTVIKEEPLSPKSEAASSPVISPHLTLTATDEPLVEESRSVRAALVPDDTRGLAPEDTPCAMSEMSDEESFETSSGSEGPGSPTSLAESRRHVLIDRTISWMISWVDSRLGVLAFQGHGTHGEGHQESPRPQTKTCRTTTGLTQENRKGRQKGGRGPGDEDSDGEGCVPPPPQVLGAADNDENLEFACPFLKHNSRKYQNIRSCSASGWKSIPRLKSVSSSTLWYHNGDV